MARISDPHDDYRHGNLLVEPHPSTNYLHVYYIPSQEKLMLSGLSADRASDYRVKLLEIDVNSGRLTIYPINTLGGHADFLKPKYSQIRRITLDDGQPVLSTRDDSLESPHDYSKSITFDSTRLFAVRVDATDTIAATQSTEEILEILESLPSGFTKDYDYGLGLAKAYAFIVMAIEKLSSCKEIFISRSRTTGVDQEDSIFYISTDDFEAMRKTLNSRTSLGRAATRSVKETETYNFLAQKIGQEQISLKLGRHPLRKLLTRAIEDNPENLSDDDQEEVLNVFSKSVKSIAEAKPEQLASLRNDIELVNLEVLIGRYEAMMASRHKEPDWQRFLNANPFVLGLAFGYPIVIVQDQASVGGRKLSAKGEKLADFLVKNSMTNNTAIIEIKTPQSELLNKSSFRDGIFTPSSGLSGSINQVLDQKYQFQREISSIMIKSKLFDLASYSVHCCLIIGTLPSGDDQQKSFEMFRGNSKNVQIITFDELLEKLKNLRDFLATPEPSDADPAPPLDVLF